MMNYTVVCHAVKKECSKNMHFGTNPSVRA